MGRSWHFSAGIMIALLALITQTSLGQESPDIAAPSGAASNGVLSREIAAQPLPQALSDLADQTGLQIIYVSALVEHRLSRHVAAGVAPSTALARLLAGTGLQYEFLNRRTVRIFTPPPASARAVPVVQKTAVADEPLNEVLVTATKRSEPVGFVPISIAVLSADDMDEKGVKGIGDIAAQTPGLQFDYNSAFGPGLLTNISIRGISNTQGSPTTGLYIDDVPIQSALSVFRNAYPVVFDLARVEVLRGPQGTLFGSSALGGAVRFITNEASTTQSSELYHAETGLTQDGGPSIEGGAAVGGPIVDGILGARVSVWYRSEGGYIDRVDPLNDEIVDSDANRSVSRAIRAGFTLEPTDSLRIVPSLTYQSVDLHDTPTFYTYLSDPDDGDFRNGRLLRQPVHDTFTLSSLKLQQRWEAAELTSITAYFDREASATDDETNAACAANYEICGNRLGPAYPSSYSQAVPNLLGQHQSAFSQELRVASTAPDARLTWLVGAFLWRTHLNDTTDAYLVTTPNSPGLDGATLFYGLQVSVFGQIYFAPSPRWRLGVGTRRGWSRGDSTAYNGGFLNLAVSPTHAVGSFSPLPASPRFDVSYRLGEGNFLYAALAEGARPGGSNTPAQCGIYPVPGSYSSDALWNYEVGAKDRLFDGHLQLSSSVFLIRWNSIQEHVTDDCGDNYTSNNGAATSKGFDLAAEAVLTERWRASVMLGLTDARYDRTVLTANGQVVVDRGTVVGALPSVPAPWSGSVSVQYRWPMRANIAGYAEADDRFSSHNGGPFTDNDPNSINYSPGFRADPAMNSLNMRLGFQRGPLDVRLWLSNALNSDPVLHLNSDVNGSTLYYAYTLRPRTLGLAATWKR